MVDKKIKLSELIKIDEDCQSSISLIDNIGDSYLVQNNLPYRRIREEALSSGVNFSSDPPFMDIYQKASLFCLEEILETNTVPYFKTAKVLRFLSQKYPDLTINEVLSTLTGFANYLAHESAHCIVHRTLTLKDENFKNCLIQDLLSESVAFCSDFYCALNAKDKEEDMFFVDMNCYSSSRRKQNFYFKLLAYMSPEQINSFLVRSYVGVLLTPLDLDDLVPVMDRVLKTMNFENPDLRVRGELLNFFEGLYGITIGFRENCVPLTYRKKNLFTEFQNLQRLQLVQSNYVLDEYKIQIDQTVELLNKLFVSEKYP